MTGHEEGNIPGFHIAAFLVFLTVFYGQDGMYVDLHQFIHKGPGREGGVANGKDKNTSGDRQQTGHSFQVLQGEHRCGFLDGLFKQRLDGRDNRGG